MGFRQLVQESSRFFFGCKLLCNRSFEQDAWNFCQNRDLLAGPLFGTLEVDGAQGRCVIGLTPDGTQVRAVDCGDGLR